MEFKEANYPKEDCLRMVRFLTVDIFEYKIMKLLIALAFVMNVIVGLVQTYQFLVVFGGAYFVLYSPLYFATSFIIAALAATLVISHLVKETMVGFELWNPDSADDETSRRIKMEAKIITTYFVVHSILAILSGFLHMFPSKQEKITFFAYEIFEKYTPSWKAQLSWMYGASFILAALATPATCNQAVYMASHTRFQFYMLLNYARTLDTIDGDCANELELYYNNDYQKEIREKIIFIAKTHIAMLQAGINLKNKVKIFIALLALSGFALGLSILIFLYKVAGNVGSNYVRITTLVLAASSTLMAVVTAGQLVENICEELFKSLISAKWYIWNNENRKLYLILMENLIKPYRLEFSQNVSVNFELGVSIGKGLYSMVSVLKRIT